MTEIEEVFGVDLINIKKIKDLDIRGLAYMLHGLEITPSSRMKKANIQFLIRKLEIFDLKQKLSEDAE